MCNLNGVSNSSFLLWFRILTENKFSRLNYLIKKNRLQILKPTSWILSVESSTLLRFRLILGIGVDGFG